MMQFTYLLSVIQSFDIRINHWVIMDYNKIHLSTDKQQFYLRCDMAVHSNIYLRVFSSSKY